MLVPPIFFRRSARLAPSRTARIRTQRIGPGIALGTPAMGRYRFTEDTPD
jgi:hypothetical protein